MSEFDVSQAHILQHLNLVLYVGYVLEKFHGAVHRHIQHIRDAFSLEAHLEGLAVVAFAVTMFAGYVHIGQEIHLDRFVAVALAGFATTAAHVEGEASGLVPTDFRLGQSHVEGTDVGENTRISGRIRARSTTQRTLIHGHDFVNMLDSIQRIVGQRFAQRAVEMFREDGQQRVVDECALSAARHARDAGQCAQREGGGHTFEVVAARSAQGELEAVALAPFLRNLNAQVVVQVARCQCLLLEHLLRRALIDHLAAQTSRARSHIYDVIGGHHHVAVVLNDHNGISRIAQIAKGLNESHVVALVEADAGLVEDIEHIYQLRTNLRGQSDALTFATRECHRGAAEREIA